MYGTTEKWLLTIILGGGLLAGTAVAQTAPTPIEPPAGTRADVQEDKKEVQELRAQTEQDKLKLQQDTKTYGPKSSQVQADEAQLKKDHQQMRLLRQDVDKDHQMAQQRRAFRHR
jgi:uncharacterized protein involved in exopolysaccharide biosynthesis